MRIVAVSPFHDGSACEMVDGVVTQYYREERLSRRKHDAQPFLSVEKIFQNTTASPDAVVIASPDQYDPTLNVWQQYLAKRSGCNNVIDMSNEHHLQHAHLAYYNSFFKECYVIVADRIGSRVADVFREGESVYYFHDGLVKMIYKNFWLENTPNAEQLKAFEEYKQNNSETHITYSKLGWCRFYEMATTVMNQHPLDAGKAMGLSAYGAHSYTDLMKDFTIPNSSYSEDVLLFGERVSKWKDIDIAKELDIDNYIDYANVANAVQTSTQQALEYMVGHLYNMGQQKINNFAVTGGYAYNVVANGNLVKKYPSLNFYFEPNADDGGNSIGAAMAVYYWQTGNKPNLLHDCFYHGIEHELNITDGIDYTNVDCATDLARGKIVATYYGKAEAGPRALGHRSILHDPRNPNAKETVNEVKQREWYRPFAACVLEEYAHEWFSIPKNFASPHMTESYQVLKPTVIPGVVHVDGSCRIQTVNETNILYPILMEFYKQTGVPVLLNTSFNLHGQPLIETPDQAIDTLRSTYIDVLYFPKIEKCLENKG